MDESGRTEARRGRPPAPLVDRTALDGSEVDVASRIGWMLRISRLTAAPELSLRDLTERLASHGISVSESSLSRVETGRLRSGVLVEAYERALDLPPSSLRAPLGMLNRSIGTDWHAEAPEPGIAVVSRLVEPVVTASDDDELTGSDWLAWAEVVAGAGAALISARQADRLVRRLAQELRRSVGAALPARYEALAQLRRSRYGDLVLQTALELLDDESAPPQADLGRALGELPCLPLLHAVAERLEGASICTLEAMASALETAKSVGGAPSASWELLSEPLLSAYRDARGDPWRLLNLAYLVRLLPGSQRRDLLVRLGTQLPDPMRSPMDWTATRRNDHFTIATEVAGAVTGELGLPDQPMLARLLFEGLYDPRMSRELPAAMLLAALPFSDVLVRHLARLHEESTDEATRTYVTWLLMRMRTPHAAPHVRSWLGPDNRGLTAALLVAFGGGPLEPEDVRAHWDGPESFRARALVPLALGEHPRLQRIAAGADPDADPGMVARARFLADAPGRLLR